MPEKKELVGFCLIISLAAVLRFTGIGFDSLWLDESYQSLAGIYGHGIQLSQDMQRDKFLFRFAESPPPVHGMLSNFRLVDPLCPPLYAVLLNRWILLWGSSDFALRSLSATISTLSVAILMIFCRAWLGPRAAFIAGLLNAVSPFDIHYAQEARMYSLVTFNSVLSGGTLLLILRSDLRSWGARLLLPLYAVSTWALINSHYTALFLAAAQGAASTAWLLWKRNWRVLIHLIVAWLVVAAMWIPWLPLFLKSASSRKESFYVSRVPDLIWPIKALFVRVPVNWLAYLSGQRVVAYACGIYASSAVMLGAAAFNTWRKEGDKKFELLALWLWAIVPAFGLWLIDVVENHRVVEVARYVIYTAPAIFMLAAWGMTKLLAWPRSMWLILPLHVVFAGLNLYYTHTVFQREPWREMAASVEQLVPDDEVLVVSQYYDIVCLDRYLPRPRRQLGLSPAMGKEAVQNQLLPLNSFALLTAQEGESIADLIPQEFKVSKKIDMAHGLHLRLYGR